MLRKQAHATLRYDPSWLTGRGWVTLHLSKRVAYRVVKLNQRVYQEKLQLQQIEPMLVVKTETRAYWQFRDSIYADTDNLTEEEVRALLISRRLAQERRLDRARQLVDLETRARTRTSRQAIPDDLKILIWTRDEGACRRCGATTDLQFDHVIPVALGGATNEANLQILCGMCNRLKGARITVG